ncbi:DndE family protein [Halomonas heilongjiangensis]|uniref:DUF1832 domain-containing protein n=1 Tax=Halomonas heilongjiangensis TaxID=1387883 RepID=A0A2N7TQM5_9GAMM|nr:hypothetical protein C1H66_06565 [Halomonas heilongjiangensis]PXX91368.1 hypothetical protein CR158_07595 [Halomonas heilongjiangensis]
MFPTRIHLNKKTWDRLQYLQTKTRLTPNVIARVAITLALRDTRTASISDSHPDQTHIINRDVLFGEHEQSFQAMIRQFLWEQNISSDIQAVIRSLIDSGLHKLGHVQSLSGLAENFFERYST